MKVLNFFIASGIVTSLLSSISSKAIYAGDTVSDDYSKYAYIDRNFEKNNENEKNEEKNSSVLKNVLVGFSALLGLGTLGAGTWQVHKRFKKTGPSSPSVNPSVNPSVILYTFDWGTNKSNKYEILDYNYNVLMSFPTVEERSDFIKNNGFIVTRHIFGYDGKYGLGAKREKVQHILSKEEFAKWYKMYGKWFAF